MKNYTVSIKIMKKPFDKVNRSFLLQILENVSSKFVNALRSIVRSCVRFQATKSRFFTSFNGLKGTRARPCYLCCP